MKYIAYELAPPASLPVGNIVNVADADWSAEIKAQYAATHGFGTYDGDVVIGDVVVMANGAAVLDSDGHLQLVPPALATRKGLIHAANVALDDSHITDLQREKNAKHNFRNARKHFEREDSDANKADMEEACADFQEMRHHATPAHYYKATLDAVTGKIRLEDETAGGEKIAKRVKDFHAAYGTNVSEAERAAAVTALKTLYDGKTHTEFLSNVNFEATAASDLITANERITITSPKHVRMFIKEFRLVNGVEAQVGETYDIPQEQSQSFDSGWTKLEITILNAESDNGANPLFSVESIGFDVADFRFAVGDAAATATFPTLSDGNNNTEITVTQAAA